MEDLGASPFIVKGHQYQIFLDRGPLASERIPVVKWWWSSSGGVPVLCFRVHASDFSYKCSWRSKFSPLHTFPWQDLWFWSLVSEKGQDHFELVLGLLVHIYCFLKAGISIYFLLMFSLAHVSLGSEGSLKAVINMWICRMGTHSGLIIRTPKLFGIIILKKKPL